MSVNPFKQVAKLFVSTEKTGILDKIFPAKFQLSGLLLLLHANIFSQLQVPQGVDADHVLCNNQSPTAFTLEALLVQQAAASDGVGNTVAVIERNQLLTGNDLFAGLVVVIEAVVAAGLWLLQGT